MKTIHSLGGVMLAVLLIAGQSMESGIAEYNQVLRMIVDGRAAIEAGQPHNYLWTCLDEKNPCVIVNGSGS